MPYTLEAVSGPASGRQFNISTDGPMIFGRGIRANFAIPEDPHLSGVHFSVERSGDAYTLCDLGSTNGTYLRDERVTALTLAPGVVFTAGNSTFRILAPPADEWPGFPPEKKKFISKLYDAGEPVFAVLDASRDDRIPSFLAAFDVENQSLYEGNEAEELRDVAPYLALVPKSSKLIHTLFHEGWGRSWGIYLTSKKSLADIRQHLQKFLTLHSEDGRARYFRFYDPRILRAYLPSRTAEEELAFYGPVSRFVVQGADPTTAIEFRRPDPGMKTYLKLPD